jgi:hypothetical protein
MDGSHKSGDASGDGRWLTYGELARIRGISKASAERMVFRNGWRRQKDNQRIVRALVPLNRLTGDASGEPSGDGSGGASPDASGDMSGVKAAFETALAAVQEAHAMAAATLRERAAAAERLAEVERERADAAERKTGEVEEALAFERVRVESLQRDVAAHLSMAAEASHGFEAVCQRAQEAERAAEQLRRAEAERKGQGRWARLKAAWKGE